MIPQKWILGKSGEDQVCGDVSTYIAHVQVLRCTHSTYLLIAHEVGGTTTREYELEKEEDVLFNPCFDSSELDFLGDTSRNLKFHPRFWNVLQKFLGHFSQAKVLHSKGSCLEFRSDTGRCVRAKKGHESQACVHVQLPGRDRWTRNRAEKESKSPRELRYAMGAYTATS